MLALASTRRRAGANGDVAVRVGDLAARNGTCRIIGSVTSTTEAGRTSRLLRSQEARRARVIEAVLTLADEGGYDAVQIRAASERSGVATDTIYRYFGAREALISAAVLEWVQREVLEQVSTWFHGDTPAEKVLAAFRHHWELWARHPNMLETFLRSTLAEGNSADSAAQRARETIMPLMTHVLADVDADYREDMLMVLEHVTSAAMIAVVQGQTPIDNVAQVIERTVRRLSQHPAMAAARPETWGWAPGV